jgi:cytidylate kinase
MTKSKINIAIDGPAGAGKSTIAKLIAKKLKIIYLDTGAMYRAAALKCLRDGANTKDFAEVSAKADTINIKIEYNNSEQRVFLDEEDITEKIRTQDVTIASSDVAVVPAIRKKLVELQRKIAENNSVIMDGRDIGTYVLPNADFKFFLTASVDERAKRRFSEQIEKGMTNLTFEQVLNDITYRDKNDSSRAFAPLAKAPDSIEIDTTNLSIEQVVNEILCTIGGKGCSASSQNL